MAGTSILNWVVPDLSKEEAARREQMSTNWTYMLDIALENLHKCLWIGLLEKKEQSMELLRYQSGLRLKLEHKRKTSHPKPRQEETEKLRKLMPLDLYIYEYAKQLFAHRWNLYKKQTNPSADSLSNNNSSAIVQDITLSLPNVIDGCVSTKSTLSCPNEEKI